VLYAIERRLDTLNRRLPAKFTNEQRGSTVAGYYLDGTLMKLVASTPTDGRIHYYFDKGAVVAILHKETSGQFAYAPRSRLYYVLRGSLVAYRTKTENLSKADAQAELEKLNADLVNYRAQLEDSMPTSSVPENERGIRFDEDPEVDNIVSRILDEASEVESRISTI